MNPIITDKKYVLGTIGNALTDLTINQKSIYKSREIAKLPISDFSLRGISVSFIAKPQFLKNTLVVSVSAKRGLTNLRVDNPLVFVNPPIMVWDGTYHQEFNKEFNVTLNIMNYVENATQALQEIITQTIEGQN